jgi:hypothetical protein
MRLMATYFRTGAGAARIMNIVPRNSEVGKVSDLNKIDIQAASARN